ncbi:MAG: PaaI family thioesterase [Myxococcales bacterium]|nr:PaaI family thioesterase [Myxococcales bacterium]
MSGLIELVQRARSQGEWSALVEAVPYLRFLGVSVEERDGELLGRMRFSGHLVGNPSLPALHGGTLGALLEGAAQFELIYRAETLVLPKTITITVDYLRSGRAQDTWARARIVRKGRRVTTVHSTAWQDDESKPIAAATTHLLILGTAPP